MAKHFSPRLKELAVKQFMTNQSILYVANFLETTPEKVEQAIRAKLLEDEESLKRVAERFVDNVFDGQKGDYTQARGILPIGPNEELPEVRIRRTRDED